MEWSTLTKPVNKVWSTITHKPTINKYRRVAKAVAHSGYSGSGAAAIIGGSAAVGALSGGIVDGDHRFRGALAGAVVGASGGFGYRALGSAASKRFVTGPLTEWAGNQGKKIAAKMTT